MAPSQNIDTVLEARNLVVQLGSGFQLGPINLTLQKGETLSILGPSGSGKSTLLHTLSGHQVLQSGNIHILGNRVDLTHQLVAGYSNVRIVFQDAALAPYQRIRDILRRELYQLSDAKRIHRMEVIANNFQIEPFLDRKTEELSAGQRQRCAIAIAFSAKPALLTLDEPFTNLDAWQRQWMLEAVRAQAKEDKTALLLTSHQLIEAQYLSDKVLVLDEGHPLFDGPLSKLGHIDHPQIQALFGWVSGNENKYSRLAIDPTQQGPAAWSIESRPSGNEFVILGKRTSDNAIIWVSHSEAIPAGIEFHIAPQKA